MLIFIILAVHWNIADGLDCLQNEFKCNDEYLCISGRWVCDGIADCYDFSDEDGCNQQTHPKSSSHVPRTSATTTTRELTTSIFTTSTSTTTPMPTTNTTPPSAPATTTTTTATTTLTTSTPSTTTTTTTTTKLTTKSPMLPTPTTSSHGPIVFTNPSTRSTRSTVVTSDYGTNSLTTITFYPAEPLLTINLCSLRNITSCRSGTQCVPKNYLCDGIRDCSDGSDEESCGDLCTDPNEVKCGSGNCQKTSVWCQGLSSCYSQKNPKYCSNMTFNPREALETPRYTKRACSPVNEFTCANGNCISRWWICDGVDDCFDYSDELNCSTGPKCPKGYAACFNSSTCIGSWQVCNRYEDCPDGSDEVGCQYGQIVDPVYHLTSSYLYWIVRQICNDDEFKCPDNPSNECMPLSWRCDGVKDCRNGEDESNCQPSIIKTCEETKRRRDDVFQCFNASTPHSSSCLNPSLRCNWALDCPDGSDEVGCYCDDKKKLRMRCNSFHCLSSTRWCDGVQECADGSDERYCREVECLDNSFRCNALRKCLPMEYRCNRVVDCPDGSDEMDCPCPPDRGFRCEERGKCLEFGRFCDGIRDCTNGADEPRDCKLSCAPNMFQCRSSRACVHPTSVCDAIVDCDDGSDEMSCKVEEI